MLVDPTQVSEQDYAKLIAWYPYVQALRMASFQNDRITDDQANMYLRGTNITPYLPDPAHVSLPKKEAKEDVTVYHDEHLPYSFLWWLHKTREEFAQTYKPYTSAPQVQTPQVPSLDQQIREHIFHLQEPEEKLSTKTKTATINFAIPKKTDQIIDRFIREEPKINPPSPEKITLENKARASADEQMTVVTETLANIYADQGHYLKAIEAFEKLSLKFPEKSAYFAARITELKNKII